MEQQAANHLLVICSQRCLTPPATPALLRVPAGLIFQMVLISCCKKTGDNQGLAYRRQQLCSLKNGGHLTSHCRCTSVCGVLREPMPLLLTRRGWEGPEPGWWPWRWGTQEVGFYLWWAVGPTGSTATVDEHEREESEVMPLPLALPWFWCMWWPTKGVCMGGMKASQKCQSSSYCLWAGDTHQGGNK